MESEDSAMFEEAAELRVRSSPGRGMPSPQQSLRALSVQKQDRFVGSARLASNSEAELNSKSTFQAAPKIA